jgi:hypothetical protein
MSLYDSATFDEFWQQYQELHASPRVRKMHAVATLSAATLLAVGIKRRSLPFILAAPVVDYAIAQLSHRGEGVRTQPYRKPLWHLRAELRLLRRTLHV